MAARSTTSMASAEDGRPATRRGRGERRLDPGAQTRSPPGPAGRTAAQPRRRPPGSVRGETGARGRCLPAAAATGHGRDSRLGRDGPGPRYRWCGCRPRPGARRWARRTDLRRDVPARLRDPRRGDAGSGWLRERDAHDPDARGHLGPDRGPCARGARHQLDEPVGDGGVGDDSRHRPERRLDLRRARHVYRGHLERDRACSRRRARRLRRPQPRGVLGRPGSGNAGIRGLGDIGR